MHENNCQNSVKTVEISATIQRQKFNKLPRVGGVAQLVERRSLAGDLSLSCARPAADG